MGIIKRIKAAVKNIPPKRAYYFACIVCGCFMFTGLINLQAVFFPTPVEDPKLHEETVNYSKFMELVRDKKLDKATVQTDKVEATQKDGSKVVFYHGRILTDTNLPNELNEAGIDVNFPEQEKASILDYIGLAYGIILPLVFLFFFLAVGSLMFGQMKGKFSKSWMRVVKHSKVRFADVAGQDEGKGELEEIRTFLKSPEFFSGSGARVPRGVLLVGPAGTGKTLLAEALAGEAGVSFIAVSGSDFSNMFVGTGRDRVEDLFKKARKLAPCIVFIDEFDSVARKRGASTSDVSREQDTTLNQLLTEMSGFGKRDGIVVVAATNRVDVLDEAAIRPGRFDRHVFIGLPDLAGREAILKVHTRDKPLADDVDLRTVARGTPGYSGADLENLANEAATFAARRGIKETSRADFEAARDKIIMGLERKSPLSDREKRLTAYHEAGHAVVICLSPAADPLHKVTILPRGRSLGLAMQLPENERLSVTRAELLARLDVMMAGRAAEELAFGEENITSGAMSDIEEATKIATPMVVSWGMSKKIGMIKLEQTGIGYGQDAEAEIRRIIEDAYLRAKDMLTTHRDVLDAVTAALLETETLNGDEVRAIVDKLRIKEAA